MGFMCVCYEAYVIKFHMESVQYLDLHFIPNEMTSQGLQAPLRH
jgi:hypothetical protein